MKSLGEMSKAEMQQELAATCDFVNNGGILSQEQWERAAKIMELVKED